MGWCNHSQYARHRGQNVHSGERIHSQTPSRMSCGGGHTVRGSYGSGFCDGLCDGLGSFLKLGVMLTTVTRGIK